MGGPTFLGNDANLAALAEYSYGAARGIRDMIYLTISTGIGSGVIVGRAAAAGREGLAAEAGHVVIDPDGPRLQLRQARPPGGLCRRPGHHPRRGRRLKNGKKSRITKMVGGDLSRVTPALISEAAQEGDKLATNAFQRAGHYLGIGIANLLHLFNPRMVVLGGSV